MSKKKKKKEVQLMKSKVTVFSSFSLDGHPSVDLSSVNYNLAFNFWPIQATLFFLLWVKYFQVTSAWTTL